MQETRFVTQFGPRGNYNKKSISDVKNILTAWVVMFHVDTVFADLHRYTNRRFPWDEISVGVSLCVPKHLFRYQLGWG